MPHDELEQIGRIAAGQASVELALRSFGAIEGIELESVELREDKGEAYYVVRWRLVSMGESGEAVSMVVLPEFITDGDGPEWLADQMTAYIVERVLRDQEHD